jgi:hypothetical protein
MTKREQLPVTEFLTPTGAVWDFGTAAPTTGTHKLGAIRWNTAPAAAGVIGWTCTAAGTPGTWKTVGTIES